MKIGFFGFNNGVLADSEAIRRVALALLPGRLRDAEGAVRFIERTAQQFSL